MSYLTYEQSDFDGQPVELFRFALNETCYLYTSADREVTVGADTYQPTYINRGGFSRGNDINKSTLNIEVAGDNPLALMFRSGWLPGVMVVTVFRYHIGDVETAVLWKGRVTGCSWSGSSASLATDSVFTLFSRPGIRRVYQVTCPHPLYGNACRVAPNGFQFTGVVASAAGCSVTVTGAEGFPAGYFVGGIFKFGDHQRLITDHAGASITLIAGVDGMGTGDFVGLWPGCDRTTATCAGRFNNLDNYGGFPWIPTKNPFKGDAII